MPVVLSLRARIRRVGTHGMLPFFGCESVAPFSCARTCGLVDVGVDQGSPGVMEVYSFGKGISKKAWMTISQCFNGPSKGSQLCVYVGVLRTNQVGDSLKLKRLLTSWWFQTFVFFSPTWGLI